MTADDFQRLEGKVDRLIAIVGNLKVGVAEAAQVLGCHEETVRERCRAGLLPYARNGRQYEFVVNELIAIRDGRAVA